MRKLTHKNWLQVEPKNLRNRANLVCERTLRKISLAIIEWVWKNIQSYIWIAFFLVCDGWEAILIKMCYEFNLLWDQSLTPPSSGNTVLTQPWDLFPSFPTVQFSQYINNLMFELSGYSTFRNLRSSLLVIGWFVLSSASAVNAGIHLAISIVAVEITYFIITQITNAFSAHNVDLN